jgi:cell wall-associated NlpC family hydrolase
MDYGTPPVQHLIRSFTMAQTTTTARKSNASKRTNADKRTNPAPATLPTLAQQVASAAGAMPAQSTTPALPHGVRVLKQGATGRLPANCPALLTAGAKKPNLGKEHTATAWQAIAVVLDAHKDGAPAQDVLDALVAINHTSFFGYALRSGWLAAAPVAA